MIDESLGEDEAVLDLLVSRVTEGISPSQEAQLLEGLRDHGRTQSDCFEHAAAATAVAFCRRDSKRARMPADLKQRIVSRACAVHDTPEGAEVVYLSQKRAAAAAQRGQSVRRPWLSGAAVGWYAAAALALVLVLPRPETASPLVPAVMQQRATLLASAADVVTLPWMQSDQDGYQDVTGDVVWSDSAQAGFLRLVGLPVNQPAVAQYQLWIIDPDRDDEPVDGGVFDVTADGEVLIPITAKLDVDEPQAFALTLEQPGGVVVSAGPLILVAASAPRSG